MHRFLLQTALKWVQLVAFLNKYPLRRHLHITPFCIKTNPLANRFFAARCAIGGRRGHS